MAAFAHGSLPVEVGFFRSAPDRVVALLLRAIGVAASARVGCGLVTDCDENAASNILNRGVVVPGTQNVAACSERASGNIR